jgi:hypothetical protein
MKSFREYITETEAFGSVWIPTRPPGNTRLTVPVQPGSAQPPSTSTSGLSWDQYTDMVNTGKIIPLQPDKSKFQVDQERMATAAYNRVQARRAARGRPATPEEAAQDQTDTWIQ